MTIKFLNEGKKNLIEVTYSINENNIPNNKEYILYKGELYEVGMKTTDYDKNKVTLRAFCNYL
jgi:hypothetical protein